MLYSKAVAKTAHSQTGMAPPRHCGGQKSAPPKAAKAAAFASKDTSTVMWGGVALTGQMMAGSSVQCAATSSYGKQGAKAAYSPYTALHGEQGTTAAPDGRAHMYHKPLAHVHLHVGARMGALLQSNRWTTR